jgi:hypothetical protein
MYFVRENHNMKNRDKFLLTGSKIDTIFIDVIFSSTSKKN